MAEALDRGEDVIGPLGRSESLGSGIGGSDVCGDGELEVGDGSEQAASDGMFGRQSEEALDVIDP